MHNLLGSLTGLDYFFDDSFDDFLMIFLGFFGKSLNTFEICFRAICFGLFGFQNKEVGSLELLYNLRMPCLYSSGCNVHNSRTVVVFVYM